MPTKWFLLGVCAAIGLLANGTRAAEVEFNRDIRPIFSETCFHCHGPDSASRKADLRLDRREVALGKLAIDPGHADKSEMIKRIFSTDKDEMMPPPDSHLTLTDAQKDMLKRWVAAGAEYQPHWSFIAPKRSELPPVKDAAWARNPIDRFTLSRMEQAGLHPAPEADRPTLARRAALDITGLPPSPEQVEQFLSDKAADAYETYVDRLLASPKWGEHRGRYWLDGARYADTNGIHFDNYREMWPFRDWVIAAFNRNEPFDRFTVEQLAGDLLPDHSMDQQVASGFNRCNITTNEGGAINEEYLVLYARDRTETTSQIWLGLTTGCAVCHDHKFDPLTQKEFYQLSAYFNNTTQEAMDGNRHDTPPTIFVPKPEDRVHWDAVAAERPTIHQQLEARKQTARADFDKWVATAAIDQVVALTPTEGLQLQARLSEGSGQKVSMCVNGADRTLEVHSGVTWDDGYVADHSFKSQPGEALEIAEAGDFDKNQSYTAAAWVKLTNGGSGSVIARMDDKHDYRGWDLWIESGRVGAHLINAWDRDAMKVLSKATISPGQWNHLMVTYDGSGKAAGLKIYINGKPQETQVMSDRLQGTTKTTVPLKIAQRNTTSRLDNALIQDVRVYGRALSGLEASQLAMATRVSWLLTKAADKRGKPGTDELFSWWLGAQDKPTQELAARLESLAAEENAMKSHGSTALVMNERAQPPKAFVLNRGEYDKRRDEVKCGTPSMLPAMPADLPQNRLGLAQWLIRPENPLTARVTVNRFWQELFGVGIVRTTGDFGATGEQPSHPELLDWLAVEFRESGWDVKKFYRLMLTSATYRQAATLTPEKIEKDGQNRLLSRGPRFRMDGEMVRDYALASSGLLTGKMGGPSVKPYQPANVWEAVAMRESNTHDYKQDHGESLYRRSLYTFWKRAAPPASMDIFNAPSRETCTVRRERTDTPLQALVTLNDPQYVEAARVLAEHALKQGGADWATQLDYITYRLLCRSLRAEEAAVAKASFDRLMAFYQAHAEEAKQLLAVGEMKSDPAIPAASLATWTMLTNELMNLDETLNK